MRGYLLSDFATPEEVYAATNTVARSVGPQRLPLEVVRGVGGNERPVARGRADQEHVFYPRVRS